MRYPQLVRPSQCNVPIQVIVYSGEIDEDGAPEISKTINTVCNYQENIKTTYTEQKEVITITGSVYFPGDPFGSDTQVIDGIATIQGRQVKIYRSSKALNPDGTVNFTKLELV